MNIIEVYRLFPTEADCIAHLEQVRWKGKPVCPYCASDRVTPLKKEHRHHCNNCNTTFSVTVNTIFHHTHLPLQKWFLAISLILNARKGISARQLARDLEINKNTAWYLSMRIRKAMIESSQRDLLHGLVEMDETYIGGKPRKKRPKDGEDKPKPLKRGRGTSKTPVVGMMERGGRVKAKVVQSRKLQAKTLATLVRANVDTKNATLITDEFSGYIGISSFMVHESVSHRVWYVDGHVHTNGIESFWALLKRGIIGQFHKVSLKHLHRYVDEFCFRFNHRKHSDIFGLTISRALGVAA